MEILRGDLSNVKGIPPSGLCVGVIAPGRCTRKWSPSTAIISRSGRSGRISISPLSKKRAGGTGIRSTSDIESIDTG